VESASNSICKERNLQGMELARNRGGICKEWTLQGMWTMLCLSQLSRRLKPDTHYPFRVQMARSNG